MLQNLEIGRVPADQKRAQQLIDYGSRYFRTHRRLPFTEAHNSLIRLDLDERGFQTHRSVTFDERVEHMRQHHV